MLKEVEKDCFDSCGITSCMNFGHEVFNPGYCLADPMIDRYEKRKTIKEPCNTCKHRDTKYPCHRCTHGTC